MSRVAISIILAVVTASSHSPSSEQAWRIDRGSVHVGGCIAIVIEGSARQVPRYMLRIGTREAVRLADSLGPTCSSQRHTIVLLSHDWLNPQVFDVENGEPRLLRVGPLFAEPGEVEIELESDGTSLGIETLEVVAAPQSAEAAIDLLFPIIARQSPGKDTDDAVKGRERASLWARLPTADPDRVTPEELHELRRELRIIMQHPEWAEIAQTLVARVEASAHARALLDQEGRLPIIKETVSDLPPWPDIVAQCLDSELENPFARVVQDDIRGIVINLRILDAERRGEDTIAIIKAHSPE